MVTNRPAYRHAGQAANLVYVENSRLSSVLVSQSFKWSEQ